LSISLSLPDNHYYTDVMAQKVGTLQALCQFPNGELYNEMYVGPYTHSKTTT